MKRIKICSLVLFLAWIAMAVTASAQDVVPVDTISVAELDEWQQDLPQYDIKEYEWIDICNNPKYAIVTKDGKKGIYDMLLHRNITEIEYRDLFFSQQTMAEDSTYISLFYGTMGIKRGIISVAESTNDVLSIWGDDPNEVYSLDECTTIDKKMSKRAKKLLKAFIQHQRMDNVQIVILDAQNGHLKTWISLDADMSKEDAGKLLAHSCAGSLTKPFHTVMALENGGLSLDSFYHGVTYRQGITRPNDEVMHQAIMGGYRRSFAERKWKDLTDTQHPSANPLVIAAGFNSLSRHGALMTPTLMADSVNVEKDVFTTTTLANLHDVLSINRKESPQLAWLPDNTSWLGYATMENLYAEEDKEQTKPVGRQIQFAGVFPACNPRYTICVVADKNSVDVTPAVFQEIVLPLTKWLLRKN